MSALQKIKAVVPGLEDDVTTYECNNCDTEFESDSPPTQATCIQCFSDAVEPVEE